MYFRSDIYQENIRSISKFQASVKFPSFNTTSHTQSCCLSVYSLKQQQIPVFASSDISLQMILVS